MSVIKNKQEQNEPVDQETETIIEPEVIPAPVKKKSNVSRSKTTKKLPKVEQAEIETTKKTSRASAPSNSRSRKPKQKYTELEREAAATKAAPLIFSMLQEINSFLGVPDELKEPIKSLPYKIIIPYTMATDGTTGNQGIQKNTLAHALAYHGNEFMGSGMEWVNEFVEQYRAWISGALFCAGIAFYTVQVKTIIRQYKTAKAENEANVEKAEKPS